MPNTGLRKPFYKSYTVGSDAYPITKIEPIQIGSGASRMCGTRLTLCSDLANCTEIFYYSPPQNGPHIPFTVDVDMYPCPEEEITPPRTITPVEPLRPGVSFIPIAINTQYIVGQKLSVWNDVVIYQPTPSTFPSGIPFGGTTFHFRIQASQFDDIYLTWYPPNRFQAPGGSDPKAPENLVTQPITYDIKRLTVPEGKSCVRETIQLTLEQWYTPSPLYAMMLSHRWFAVYPYTVIQSVNLGGGGLGKTWAGYNEVPSFSFLRRKFKLWFREALRVEIKSPGVMIHYMPNNVRIEAPEYFVPTPQNSWTYQDDQRSYGTSYPDPRFPIETESPSLDPFNRVLDGPVPADVMPSHPVTMVNMPVFSNSGFPPLDGRDLGGNPLNPLPIRPMPIAYTKKVYSAIPINVIACRCPPDQDFIGPNYYTISPVIEVEDTIIDSEGNVVPITYTKEEIPFQIEIVRGICPLVVSEHVVVFDDPSTDKPSPFAGPSNAIYGFPHET